MQKEELLQELKDRVDILEQNIEKVKIDKDFKYYTHIAVDLRLLLSSKNPGNNLLGRVLDAYGVKIMFKDVRPWGEKEQTLEEWKNDVMFAINGSVFTRIKIIEDVADQRGAHFDNNANDIHHISKGIMLPFDNPAKNGVAEQNVVYITTIAEDLIRMIRCQFFNHYATNN